MSRRNGPSSSVTISPREAIRIIAQEESARDRTAQDLEQLAMVWERDALRQERIAQGARSKTRVAKAQRRAVELRGHAQLCRLAAREIGRLHVETVGQAAQGWVRRKLLRGVR